MEIIYEDNHLIAVNKSSSELVQGDKTGDKSLVEILKSHLKRKYNKPGNVFLGLVHRLDRPVSGVVLFAKTSKALTRMNRLFREQTIQKKYWAIVKTPPVPSQGELNHHLVRNQKQNKSYAYDEPVKNSKSAKLAYRLIASSKDFHLIEIELFTGRHHQIRCQLAKINCPVRGDLKYGYPRSNKDGGIDLHAREIRFIHPVKNEAIRLMASPPGHKLWDCFSDRINDGGLFPEQEAPVENEGE